MFVGESVCVLVIYLLTEVLIKKCSHQVKNNVLPGASIIFILRSLVSTFVVISISAMDSETKQKIKTNPNQSS